MGRKVLTVPIGKFREFLLISDVHFDNPKCDRVLLKRHLDEAVRRGAGILINGDLFCIMQGMSDRRGSKGQIRPEHVGDDYFDLVANTAIEWWRPYAKNIVMVGYGNHETAVLKKNEFDVLGRFVTILNHETGANIQLGGYDGWVVFQGKPESGANVSFRMYYHHGFGGGGAVTKGVIQDQRMDAQIEGADVVWMGHVHELYHMVSVAEGLRHKSRAGWEVFDRVRHHIRTGTYKNESDTNRGYHKEKGRPSKPMGGFWMRLSAHRVKNKKESKAWIDAEFSMAL